MLNLDTLQVTQIVLAGAACHDLRSIGNMWLRRRLRWVVADALKNQIQSSANRA